LESVQIPPCGSGKRKKLLSINIELRFYVFVAEPLSWLLAALEANINELLTNHSYIVNIVIIIAIRPREMQNFENLTIDANLKSASIVA